MSLRLLAALAITTLHGTCLADWQYTRWGMTVAEVTAASNGAARALTGEEKRGHSLTNDPRAPELAAPYQAGQYDFKVIFYFDSRTNGLARVSLHLERTDLSHQLLGSLNQRYGKPQSERRDVVSMFSTWHAEQDQVAYLRIGEKASVTYQPRVNQETKGL